jgi:hypothetical protein
MGNYATNKFPTDRWASSDSLDNLPECIASIDAAIRNLFGVDTGTLSQALTIDGTDITFRGTWKFLGDVNDGISAVKYTISLTPEAGDGNAVATVTAIRNLVSAMIAAI